VEVPGHGIMHRATSGAKRSPLSASYGPGTIDKVRGVETGGVAARTRAGTNRIQVNSLTTNKGMLIRVCGAEFGGRGACAPTHGVNVGVSRFARRAGFAGLGSDPGGWQVSGE